MAIAASAASSALQLVMSAYIAVKTNKERCRRLVERCETVVSRLQMAVNERGEEYLGSRIERLQETFERIVVTMGRVGSRSWVSMVINYEKDGVAIDGCHHLITDLITLFNLHELIDIGRWHHENVAARINDHHDLTSIGQRIEYGNQSISNQITNQGRHIFELLRIVKNLDPSSNPLGQSTAIGNPDDPSPYSEDETLIGSPLKTDKVIELPLSPASSKTVALPPNDTSTLMVETKVTAVGKASSTPASPMAKSSLSKPDSPQLPPTPPEIKYSKENRSHGFHYVPPPSEASSSQISHRAVRASDSPPPLERDKMDNASTPAPAPKRTEKSKDDIPHSRWTEHLSDHEKRISEDDFATVEVFLIPDVPDSGFLLEYADHIGMTTMSILRQWTDTSALVAQTVRFEGHNVLLRSSPTTNPFRILTQPHDTSQPDSRPIPRHRWTFFKPEDPIFTSKRRNVFMVQSLGRISLILVSHRHKIIHRAIFPWSTSIRLSEMKNELARLIVEKTTFLGRNRAVRVRLKMLGDVEWRGERGQHDRDDVTLGEMNGMPLGINHGRDLNGQWLAGELYLIADVQHVLHA